VTYSNGTRREGEVISHQASNPVDLQVLRKNSNVWESATDWGLKPQETI